MAKIRLTESDLRNMIAEAINEAMQDEGWKDFFRGAGKKVGGDIANAASNAYQKGKDMAGRAAQNVRNKAQQMGTAAKNYVSDVKRAGQMSSANADNQKIADQIQTWLNAGVFGNSKQVYSWAQGLINCLNKNFNSQFGENGSASLK